MENVQNEADGTAPAPVAHFSPTAGKENKNANAKTSSGRKVPKEGKKGAAGAAGAAFGAAGGATPAPPTEPKKAGPTMAAFGGVKKKAAMTPAEKKREAEEQAAKGAARGAMTVSATVKMSTRLLARRRALSQVEMQTNWIAKAVFSAAARRGPLTLNLLGCNVSTQAIPTTA